MLKYNIESVSFQQEIDAASGISKNSSEKNFKIDRGLANTIYENHRMVSNSTHI